MAFEIKGIVETFAAKVALVFFERRVVATMTIEHPHMLECFAAQVAGIIGEVALDGARFLKNGGSISTIVN